VRNIGRLSLALLVSTMAALLIATTGCVPGAGGAGGTGGEDMSSIYLIVFMVLIIGFLYYTSNRSQKKQQKKQQELMAELRKGDKVLTMSGLYGDIDSTDEISVVLKTESGALIRVTKSSIAGKRQPV
jgi:preprotein translocase subunit YajC